MKMNTELLIAKNSPVFWQAAPTVYLCSMRDKMYLIATKNPDKLLDKVLPALGICTKPLLSYRKERKRLTLQLAATLPTFTNAKSDNFRFVLLTSRSIVLMRLMRVATTRFGAVATVLGN